MAAFVVSSSSPSASQALRGSIHAPQTAPWHWDLLGAKSFELTEACGRLMAQFRRKRELSWFVHEQQDVKEESAD